MLLTPAESYVVGVSEPSVSVRWASADYRRLDQGYEISMDVGLGSSADSHWVDDMRRDLPARLGSLLGVPLSKVVFHLKRQGPDGNVAGLMLVAPASVFGVTPSAFRRAVTEALTESMKAAEQEQARDDAVRAGWLAAVRDGG